MNVYHVHTDNALMVPRHDGGEPISVSYIYILAGSFEEALAKLRAAHPCASVRMIQRTNHVHGATVIV